SCSHRENLGIGQFGRLPQAARMRRQTRPDITYQFLAWGDLSLRDVEPVEVSLWLRRDVLEHARRGGLIGPQRDDLARLARREVFRLRTPDVSTPGRCDGGGGSE